MDFRATLESLISKEELEPGRAKAFLTAALGGELSEVQIGALLVAWQSKGATGSELAALASGLMERSLRVSSIKKPLVDTCGTGGGVPTFNLSTAAAFVVAGAGGTVAKHGNRAVTSTCGSADVLEAAGAELRSDPVQLGKLLDDVGIAFLFAPNHHPSLKAVGPLRKQLEIRTIFNQLGPLANPAGAKRQVIGVYARELLKPMAEALAQMGCERGLVVFGEDGMDEVSPCGASHAYWVEDGGFAEVLLDPVEAGIELVRSEALAPGSSLEENVAILREAISDPKSPRSKALIPSAGAALWVSGLAEDFRAGGQMARDSIATGAAAAAFDRFVAETNAL